jgi:hypothetical protein
MRLNASWRALAILPSLHWEVIPLQLTEVVGILERYHAVGSFYARG